MAAPKPSSADGEGKKVCIVVPCFDGIDYFDTSVYYKLFVVDVDVSPESTTVDGFALISPTLEIHSCGGVCGGSLTDSFCVLGDTLYMFEGYRLECEKSVKTYNLSSLLNEKNPKTKKLKKSDLTKVADMRFPKENPAAFPTPDGKKILVSSSKFDPGMFELFDPVDGSSETLPSLLPVFDGHKPKTLYVTTAHGFISKFKFAVHIDRLGTYSIDVSVPKKCWVKISFLREDRPFHLSFFVIEDRFCFSPEKAEDLRDDELSFISLPCVESFPPPAEDPDDEDIFDRFLSEDRRITLLKHDEGGRNCDFCVIRSEMRVFGSISTGSYYPWCHLIIQFCHAEYPEESGEEVKTFLGKSRKLYLRADEKVHCFDPLCFFAV